MCSLCLFVVFVGFLLFVCFPEGFWGCLKTFGKTTKTKKTNPYARVGLKPLKTCVLFVFPKVLLVFVGFMLFCCFPEGFFGFLKTFGKTNEPKKLNPYPRVGLKPLKTVVSFCFPDGFWFSLVFVFPKVFQGGLDA